MITRVHHVGVVVRRLEEALSFWRDTLGLRLRVAAEVPDQGVRAALLDCGPAEIELLEPTRPDTGVARFLDRRGEALHHLCLESDDVVGEIARLAGGGVELIDRAPRPGLAGQVAFLHPRAAGGALLELATPSVGEAAGGGPGHPAPAAPSRVGLRAVTLLVDDLPGGLRRLRAILGAPPEEPAGGEVPAIELGGVRLELAAAPGPPAGPGLGRVGLAHAEPGRLPAAMRAAATRLPSGDLAFPAALTRGVPITIRPAPG